MVVHELEPGPGERFRIAFPSNSEPGKEYIVRQLAQGTLDCNCNSFSYRSKCRHIAETTAAMLRIREREATEKAGT